MQNKYKAVLAIVIAILSYFGYNIFSNKKIILIAPITQCAPPVDNSATQFIIPSLDTVITRKNYHSLNNLEKANIDTAIARMKRLSVTDPTNPTSFAFQARIHNGPIDASDLSKPFKTCQHNECCFFLAWHRMYIYFFERIMRSKMVNTLPKPALPFWNFQDTFTPANGSIPLIPGSIPARFRFPANSSNPLYSNSRNPFFNNYPNGGVLSYGNRTAFFDLANLTNSSVVANYRYFDFQNALYNAHGNIHTSLGRWSVGLTNYTVGLGYVDSAANDPLFFLLHANVDRLWEKWLNKDTSNRNPDTSCNSYWMNKKFVFYDENKNKVFLKGRDIIGSMTGKLKYKYDTTAITNPTLQACTTSLLTCPKFSSTTKFTDKPNVNIAGIYTTINAGSFALSPDLKNYISLYPNAQFNFSNTDPNADNIFMELKGINPTLYPNGVIEIYISPSSMNAATLVPTSVAFIGNINLFDIENSVAQGIVQRINVTPWIRNYGLGIAKLSSLNVVFVARGHYLSGIEIPTTAQIKIASLKFAIYKSYQLF